MFVLEPDRPVVLSPSDLRLAATCEFALLRALDVRLGRATAGPAPDPLLERTAALGDAHEQRVLRELARTRRVVTVPRPAHTRAGLEAAALRTLDLLGTDVPVVHQAAFFDGRFVGFADFLLREGDAWTVVDAKLARTESVPALLQLGAYADRLRAAGVPVGPTVRLVLGDGRERDFPLADVLPVHRERRARLEHLVDTRAAEPGPVAWADDRWHRCGRCADCTAELERTRDVLLVAGVRSSQRARLLDAGVRTVEDLAARTEAVPGLSPERLKGLRAQARLQAAQDADSAGRVRFEVHSPAGLGFLPEPSEGDLFFDFEGDPLWAEPGSRDTGLEYLFGVVEAPTEEAPQGRFVAFWAHDRAGEKQALVRFLDYLAERRRRWPDLHVYHYAAYERVALLRLAVRHGVGEAAVDNLLRAGVLVDLYAVVREVARVSQRSYSLKKLEPLYMGEHLRSGDVTTAGDSIVAYHEYSQAVVEGRTDEAARRLAEIAAYNEYDCRSTLGLRDWLLARAAERGVGLGAVRPEPAEEEEPHELERRLRDLVPASEAARTPDEQALALLAATVQYNRRERKPYWWSHFARLRLPVEDWSRDADVLLVEESAVEQDWHRPSPRHSPRRRLRLRGRFAGGSAVGAGDRLCVLYDPPLPPGAEPGPGAVRARTGEVLVLSRTESGLEDVLLVEEVLPRAVAPHACTPLALTPKSPPDARSVDAALEALATEVVDHGGHLRPQPGLDLLRRLPPRTRSGSLPAVGAGPDRFVDAVTAALLDLDRSYLGVQGPPGTGKTHVAAHVVTRLVRDHGWKVGVVAQSHAAVENVLTAVVRAGLDPALVAKVPKSPGPAPAWTVLPTDGHAAFAREHGQSGYVVGGTAWDLTNPRRIGRDQLDLVVVDEAGQLSLATTVACSVAGSRLLLLGDPQQLPQVSQGTHPEPVDGSALGWLLDGEQVLPARLGYFLETTWRLHPALAERVSALSYAGALRSHEEVTAARSLAGVEPGLHVVRVPHLESSTCSPAEAQRVAEIAAGLLGRTWEDPGAGTPPRPLTEADVLVVTPYNAQVAEVTRALADAGLAGVAVGTMDRFQGQEAPVVIVSMAASAAADVSRGLGFLLSRNRLNVAVSRAQWAAYLLRSEVLTDFTPGSPEELLALGAFIGLCADAEDPAPAGGGLRG